MNLHYLWQDVFLLFLNFIFGVSFLPLLVFLLHNKFSFEAIHPFWKLSYSSGVLLMFYWFLSGPGVKCLHRYFLATPTVSSENVLNNLHGIQWLTALVKSFYYIYSSSLFSSICCFLIQLGNATGFSPIWHRMSSWKANRTFSLFQYSWVSLLCAFFIVLRSGEKMWAHNSHSTNFWCWIFHEPSNSLKFCFSFNEREPKNRLFVCMFWGKCSREVLLIKFWPRHILVFTVGWLCSDTLSKDLSISEVTAF